MKLPILNGLAFASLVLTAAPTAFAQSTLAAPEFREGEDYQPIGIPAGGFRFYPRLDLSVGTNDNVFAEDTGEADDTAYSVVASGRLASQWSRHALNFEATYADTTYADFDAEDSSAWSAAGDAALDITRNMRLEGALGYTDAFEERGLYDPDTLTAPIAYTEGTAAASLAQTFNRLRITADVNVSDVDYEDGLLASGAVFDQDFRDRIATEGGLRADVALSPDTSLFAKVSQRQYEYDVAGRDFDRTRALAGATFDLTNLIRGEIAAGYSWTQFDAAATEDVDGFSVRGAIDWSLTRITTVRLSADRDVGDSGDERATSAISDAYNVRLDHQLFRNVVIWGEFDWDRDEFQGIDRTDESTGAGIGCEWYVNRTAAVSARYDMTDHQSSGAQRFRDYDQNRATLALTLRR